ncbi:Uridine nucleosidase 1 [Coemansia sp. RSA 2704]|nr:Uridine nucleosidase 1 [Coemansia sp. RSA 2704]
MTNGSSVLDSVPSTPMPVWLDCDIGHDDAMALILAAHNPHLKLLGVSSVSGNSPVENTTENAIKIIQAAGIEGVKVYKGAAKPLVKKSYHAVNIHGPTGIDGTDLLPAADYDKYFASDTNAVNAMYRAIMDSNEPIFIAAVGPLTNIALLLSMYPEVIPKIKTLSIMGGAIGLGNTTAAAEFNIYCDPEAAHIVMNSGLEHIALVPLDVTHTVLASSDVIARIKKTLPEPRFAQLITELLEFFGSTHEDVFEGRDGAPLHDPVAVAYLFMRDGFVEKHIRVDVECGQGNGSGRTYCDIFNCVELSANCWVTTSVDVERFWDEMVSALVVAASKGALTQAQFNG